jgi:transposase-like protein
MPKPQLTFTAEFKNEAVQLARTSAKPKAQIARELGISNSALSSWCKQSTDHGSDAFLEKAIRLRWKKKITASNEHWSECSRSVIS